MFIYHSFNFSVGNCCRYKFNKAVFNISYNLKEKFVSNYIPYANATKDENAILLVYNFQIKRWNLWITFQNENRSPLKNWVCCFFFLRNSSFQVVHDSYHCRNPFILSNHLPIPFPTKREGKLFVSWGPTRSKSEIENLVECPFACRPKGHPDWTLCWENNFSQSTSYCIAWKMYINTCLV